MYIFKLTQLTILSDSLFPCLLPILTHKNRKSFLTIYPFQSIPLSSSNSFCFMLNTAKGIVKDREVKDMARP